MSVETDPPVSGESAAPRGSRGRGAALLGLRLAAGVTGLAAAAAVLLLVAAVPWPQLGADDAESVLVTPVAAEQVRVCPGGLLRLGDGSGADADQVERIDAATVQAAPAGAGVRLESVADGDVAGRTGAPSVVSLGADRDGVASGAQSQAVAGDPGGLAIASCTEPSSESWLVGGSTQTGRTTLVSLVNAGDVDAEVGLEVFGEDGPVSAPGLSGITVAAGTQRVLSLAGFAPDLLSPVVHVSSRGGRVAAALEQTVVRTLSPGGAEWIGPSAEPAIAQTIPGVRITDAADVANALSLDSWDDAIATVRVAVPGTDPARVRVTVVPEDASAESSFFEYDVAAGASIDTRLDAGVDTESGLALPDGLYTVSVEADVPVVAGVRVTTAVTPPKGAIDELGRALEPESDLAWFGAATALPDELSAATGSGPALRLSLANPGESDVTATLDLDGRSREVEVAAGAQVTLDLPAQSELQLRGAAGLVAAVSSAGDAQLGARLLAGPRPLAEPILVRL